MLTTLDSDKVHFINLQLVSDGILKAAVMRLSHSLVPVKVSIVACLFCLPDKTEQLINKNEAKLPVKKNLLTDMKLV